jgi:hypothetical protein
MVKVIHVNKIQDKWYVQVKHDDRHDNYFNQVLLN